MTKKVNCMDLGFDCPGVIQADTTEETLRQVAAHAAEAHGMQEVTPEVVEKIHAVMIEE